ncbi:MAG TPA: SH3 domain-containing protein, partial [Gammaproteobacteria bacterium]|nr:SH3 domain-containing protein [Gammaproteobacteria bacterium]
MKLANKISLLLCALTVGVSAASFAKEINLLDQPTANAKVIGTIDAAAGVIPIYSSKAGDWIKVGDPRNGNVGWIKSSDLSGKPGEPAAFTFTQRITNDGKNPQTYQVIYGQPAKFDNKDIQNMLQKLQLQQQSIQQSMQKAVEEMMNDFNKLYQLQTIPADTNNFPIILPVVIMPQQKAATP